MPASADLVLHLLLQLGIILAACRLLGFFLRSVRQPPVIGEMVAGVLLGPSLLGLIAPAWQRWLFPQTITLHVGATTTTVTHPSQTILYAVGQLGLVLYMFLVGLDFDRGYIRRNLIRTGSISLSSIAFPLTLGGVLGYVLGNDQRFFPSEVSPWQAALFLGCALMVTAFPVLARIIDDLSIGETRVAALALGAAATCDVAAWSLLAVIISSANHAPGIAFLAVGGGALYVLGMLIVGRPLFQRFETHAVRHDGVRIEAFGVLLVLLMLCAWFTDAVGIYSVFGAFVLGAMMPRGRFASDCQRLLETPVVALLLPIYFVNSGLNSRISLLAGGGVLAVTGAILAVAVVAKGGGSMLAGLLSGLGRQDAASLGALMNARGLMELVLVNIGLQKGLITPTLFTVLVLMTILTTLAASPLFQLLHRPVHVPLAASGPWTERRSAAPSNDGST